MKKKAIALFLSLIMACSFCLTSCGNLSTANKVLQDFGIANAVIYLVTGKIPALNDKVDYFRVDDAQLTKLELKSGDVVAAKLAK